MSFADPTSLAGYGATAVTFTGATAASMARQADGRYISTNVGTNDEPMLLFLNSNFQPGAVSTFTAKLTLAKNVAPINGVPQADDISIASLQVKQPHRSFTNANMRSLAFALLSIPADATMWDKFLRGER